MKKKDLGPLSLKFLYQVGQELTESISVSA